MSDPDDGNKTVFRPSPLAGRKAGGTLLPTPPGNPWPGQTGSATAAPVPGAAPGETRDLASAAAPVLAIASSLRAGGDAPLFQVHGQAAQAIGQFDATIRASHPEEVRRQAIYAVSATVDDAARHAPGAGRDAAEWARRSMVAQFSGASGGDDRFWSLIDEATRQPSVDRELIELLNACLAAGYEGHFHGAPDAQRQLQQAAARLQTALAPPPPPPPPTAPVAAPTAPSPIARPASAPARKARSTGAPVRQRTGRTVAIVLIVAVLLLAAAFVAARLLLPRGVSVGSVQLTRVDRATVVPGGRLGVG